jgi:hypothetical protein
MAFDHLSIPVINYEYERVFNGIKTISDYRRRLRTNIIKTLECDAA